MYQFFQDLQQDSWNSPLCSKQNTASILKVLCNNWQLLQIGATTTVPRCFNRHPFEVAPTSSTSRLVLMKPEIREAVMIRVTWFRPLKFDIRALLKNYFRFFSRARLRCSYFCNKIPKSSADFDNWVISTVLLSTPLWFSWGFSLVPSADRGWFDLF